VKELLAGMLRIETPVGTFLVPRALAAPAPMLGSEVSFSVRAAPLTDAPSERHVNRLSAVCTAVEYFGAVRRHIFERSDGEVLKYDQFGAHAARIVPGQHTVLGWPAEAAVLHAGAGG
jgi:TOBE domain